MEIIYPLLALAALVLLRIFFVTIIIWVGEAVLFLVTLGRYKPQWNYYTQSAGVIWGIIKPSANLSMIIGIVSLCLIGLAIKSAWSFFTSH